MHEFQAGREEGIEQNRDQQRRHVYDDDSMTLVHNLFFTTALRALNLVKVGRAEAALQ